MYATLFDKYPQFQLEIYTLIVLYTVIFGPLVRFLTVVFTRMRSVYFIFFTLWFLLARKFNRSAFIANQRETLPNVSNQCTSIEIKRFFPALNQCWSCFLCCNDVTIIIGSHNNKKWKTLHPKQSQSMYVSYKNRNYHRGWHKI